MAALPDTRMPSVITQEVPTLPPSIAVVPSAVPVFIGYTEKALKNGEDLTLKATRIRNIREFEAWFGVAPPQNIEVDVDDRSELGEGLVVKVVSVSESSTEAGKFYFKMYYGLQLYFANGGGPCFIISIGQFTYTTPNDLTTLELPIDADAEANFIRGIDAAKKAKDITILVLSDAVALDSTRYGNVIVAGLKHCLHAINRVTIIDVNDASGEDLDKIDTDFRTKIATNTIDEKKYGAAYYPFLQTTLQYAYTDKTVKVRFHTKDGTSDLKKVYDVWQKELKEAILADELLKVADALLAKETATPGSISNDLLKKGLENVMRSFTGKAALPKIIEDGFLPANNPDPTKIQALATNHKAAVKIDVDAEKQKFDTEKAKAKVAGDFSGAIVETFSSTNNLIYSKIREAIGQYPVIMPPSPAIAGLYVATDFSQGPWRAPANFSLAGVIRPTVDIDDDLHANLNVDSNAGKSINAIRSYIGKGVLVFGARTLAGNDLEWRYVSVRRTFCFIEDSVARAMQDFVFAPNVRDTWIKVKAMIGNFLNGIWQAGGLFGNTPDEAYQVSVGLPETMTDVDILEGRMIVVIKLRVSRPAEFIILRYEHKFQATNN